MEIWDILDEDGNKTGNTVQKGEELPKGFYHQAGDVWIINSENKILIQKRASQKKLSPNVWAMTGGSVIKGETSLQTIERETEEEMAVKLDINKAQLVEHFKTGIVWVDTYLIRQDINLNDIVMQEDEVSEVKWATYEEIEELDRNNQFIEGRWSFVRDMFNAIKYIGKEVEVKVDRPCGSSHPKYPDHIYPINYGFIPNTVSGDEEELDCYILGQQEPVKEYKGKCIAVIHRTNDNDDKLIVVPVDKKFTEEQIREMTDFQEKYYESKVIM